MYSVFQSQSTKQLKPQDIIKFSWEKESDIIEINKELYNPDNAIDILNKINQNGKKTTI